MSRKENNIIGNNRLFLNNLKLRSLIILLLLNIMTIAQPQSSHKITGIVIDTEGQGIELVNVILLGKSDSVFIKGTTTDKEGKFLFENITEKNIRIKFSCIGYEEKVYPLSSNEANIFVLKASSTELEEVSIVAERPIVKVDDGKLSFDIPSLIKNKPVNNAFDILREVPGVEKSGDNISLIGARSTTIILNGRKTSLTYAQISDLLKSLSPESIKNIEVLYSPAPQYGVQGAAINIVINKKREEERIKKGEITFTGKQAYYFSPSTGGTFSLIGKNSSFDVSYFFRYDVDKSEEKIDVVHQLLEKSYPILLNNDSKNIYRIHNFRMGYDYDFKNKDEIRISYNGNYTDPAISRTGLTEIAETTEIDTRKNSSGPSLMQNLSVNYDHKKFNIGVDYTYYRDKTDQFLINSGSLNENIASIARQTIHRGIININNSNKLSNSGTLSYGINGTISFSDDEMETSVDKEIDNEFFQQQSEYFLDIFMGWRQSFGKKFSLNTSLTYQYYKALIDSKDILWEKNNLFPNFSFIYKINKSKILQLTFASQQNYPSYWQITPNLSYLNAYMTASGNPTLKPSVTYSGRIIFILKNKYVFQLFGNRSKDHIQQLLYQRNDKLQAVYKLINLDKHDTFGGLVVFPFKVHDMWSTRLILSGFFINDKGQLEDIKFDEQKWYGRIMLSNNISLNSSKSLNLQLSGFYSTKAIQGIYKIDPLYDLSFGLLWNINKKLRLTINGEDLLNGKKLHTSTKINTQNYKQVLFQDTRNVSVSLRYTFGGYEEKKVKKVDVSRFGTD